MWGRGSDDEGLELVRIAGDELGVDVVAEPGRLDGRGLVLGVGRAAGGRREHLHAHAGLLHHLQALLDVRFVVGVGMAGHTAATGSDHASAFQGLVVGARVVVGVHVDDHRLAPFLLEDM